jgi:hypothetical protein
MPTLHIYWKAKDMAAFVAAYLYWDFFQKTHKVITKACESLDGVQWTSDSTIVLGFAEPITPLKSTHFLSISEICITDVYNWIYENQPIPDWVWLVHRLTTESDRVYFDRLMETMLRPLTQQTQGTPFPSFHSFLQRYNSPLSMLDLIQEAEQLEINKER